MRLIAAVAAANPQTIVVLETGTAVTMPWVDKVNGILEAWYAGSDGANAVANILFGDVNPSAKLPMTFPEERRRSAASDAGETTAGSTRRSRRQQIRRSQAHIQRHLRRRPESRIQVVRRREKARPVSFRLRTFLHNVCVFGIEGRAREKSHRLFVHREKHRHHATAPKSPRSTPRCRHPPANHPNASSAGAKSGSKPAKPNKSASPSNPNTSPSGTTATNEWKLVTGTYEVMVGASSAVLPLHDKFDLK